jgi:hypothetical protein
MQLFKGKFCKVQSKNMTALWNLFLAFDLIRRTNKQLGDATAESV